MLADNSALLWPLTVQHRSWPPRSRTVAPRTMNQPRAPTSESVQFLSGGGEMGARMRALDWDETPLGPPQFWPQSLKTAVRIMLTSRQPIWIGWGEELLFLYNDPYKSIIGGRHPWALGQPTRL